MGGFHCASTMCCVCGDVKFFNVGAGGCYIAIVYTTGQVGRLFYLFLSISVQLEVLWGCVLVFSHATNTLGACGK